MPWDQRLEGQTAPQRQDAHPGRAAELVGRVGHRIRLEGRGKPSRDLHRIDEAHHPPGAPEPGQDVRRLHHPGLVVRCLQGTEGDSLRGERGLQRLLADPTVLPGPELHHVRPPPPRREQHAGVLDGAGHHGSAATKPEHRGRAGLGPRGGEQHLAG